MDSPGMEQMKEVKEWSPGECLSQIHTTTTRLCVRAEVPCGLGELTTRPAQLLEILDPGSSGAMPPK